MHAVWHMPATWSCEWASYQIRQIAGCACAGNAGNVFPAGNFQGNRLISYHGVRQARAMVHAGIANLRWRGKRTRRSRRMRKPQFYASGKRPIEVITEGYTHHFQSITPWQFIPASNLSIQPRDNTIPGNLSGFVIVKFLSNHLALWLSSA